MCHTHLFKMVKFGGMDQQAAAVLANSTQAEQLAYCRLTNTPAQDIISHRSTSLLVRAARCNATSSELVFLAEKSYTILFVDFNTTRGRYLVVMTKRRKNLIYFIIAGIVANVIVFCSMDAGAFESCPSEMSGAVLDAVYWRMGSGLTDYSPSNEITKSAIADEQSKIKCIRDWAQSKTSGCTRSSYNYWLDVYQGQLDSAKKELESKNNERKLTEYDRKRESERLALDKFEREHPIPKPPECSK